MDVKITGPETGDEVDAAESGEILISGDKIAAGYHDCPELEAPAFKDGWLHTDDIGRLYEKGYLYVTGRPDDRKGQVPVAFVITEPGENLSEDSIKEWFLDRGAAFKHPRQVDLLKALLKREKTGREAEEFNINSHWISRTIGQVADIGHVSGD